MSFLELMNVLAQHLVHILYCSSCCQMNACVVFLVVLVAGCVQAGVMKNNLKNAILQVHNEGRHELMAGQVSGQPKAGNIPDMVIQRNPCELH